jgi:hypothetical protein
LFGSQAAAPLLHPPGMEICSTAPLGERFTRLENRMEGMHAGKNHMEHESRELYETPALERLGSFRELTQDGGILEHLVGWQGHDNCRVKTSSCPAFGHGH